LNTFQTEFFHPPSLGLEVHQQFLAILQTGILSDNTNPTAGPGPSDTVTIGQSNNNPVISNQDAIIGGLKLLNGGALNLSRQALTIDETNTNTTTVINGSLTSILGNCNVIFKGGIFQLGTDISNSQNCGMTIYVVNDGLLEANSSITLNANINVGVDIQGNSSSAVFDGKDSSIVINGEFTSVGTTKLYRSTTVNGNLNILGGNTIIKQNSGVTINGNVLVKNNGTLFIGDTTGTYEILTINGDFTLSSGTLSVDVDASSATGCDQVRVVGSGSVYIDQNSTLNTWVNGSISGGDHSYNVISVQGSGGIDQYFQHENEYGTVFPNLTQGMDFSGKNLYLFATYTDISTIRI
jgi:hypothetical protein